MLYSPKRRTTLKNRFRSLAAVLACLFLVSCASGDGKTPDAAVEEVGIIRTYVYTSAKGLLKSYATGLIDFDKMYDKLINVLTLYRDE